MLLPLVLVASLQSSTGPDLDTADRYIEACRAAVIDAHPPVAQITVEGLPIYCLYDGILEDPRIHGDLVDGVGNWAPDGLVVRSVGGAVGDWLDLIWALDPPFDFIIVDGACFSSCANYAFAAAHRRIVPEGGVVGWHGGPTANEEFMRHWIVRNEPPGTVPSEADMARVLELGRRTEDLYALTGASTRILEDTHNPDLPTFSVLRARLFTREPEDGRYSGLTAFPPDILERCYGFTGLEDMTHVGNDRDAFRWARNLGPGFYLFTRTDTTDERGCPVTDHDRGR
ncbi:MAG: hypothetical protein GC208_05045 [Alphaproteobacteria bacterium]|nr:hypothetical protein [Alphaproteobacteria bacterium]